MLLAVIVCHEPNDAVVFLASKLKRGPLNESFSSMPTLLFLCYYDPGNSERALELHGLGLGRLDHSICNLMFDFLKDLDVGPTVL